ncbi:kinase-like domain-containing protein [Gorgonomyces haynaldii]|nr:kinase-like domain-containing protein [Gorgonomyces haynaldii]
MYRIFHMGDSTPAEGEPTSLWGKSRKNPDSEFSSDEESDESPKGPLSRKSSIGENMESMMRSFSGARLRDREPKKGVFSMGGDDSSDYESDGPEVPETRKSKTNFFETLTKSLKPKSQSGSPSSSNSSLHEEGHGIFKDLLSTRRKTVSSRDSDKQESGHQKSLTLGRPPSNIEKTPSNGSLHRSSSETSLDEKYGKPEDVLGKGSFATVKLCCPLNSKEKYAVKEFRKRKKDESQKEYVKKLMSEFCISSSLQNDHVVKTVDLIQDSKKQWCVVMEYCAGGDLYNRICKNKLTTQEIYCYFVQLVHGVQYLHQNGVCHRDLKPENLLLDKTHRILKITDFGVSEVFKTPFATKCKKLCGVAGSGPYIAPEEFTKEEYDSELVDVWSIGVIFYVMLANSIPWKSAEASDPRYKIYLDSVSHFSLFEKYSAPIKNLLYQMLKPYPGERIKPAQILQDPWVKSCSVCTPSNADYVDHRHP